jgi:hypothetical protein
MQSKLPEAPIEATAAQRQLALERDGGSAAEWCELGERYEALASSSSDRESAVAWREKAVFALTRAIALQPGFGKAHYVLGNVYRAQDMRLALLEFEAAAKCDDAYAEALAEAREHVRRCTYTLRDLSCTVLESAQEKPRPEILASEFYFEDGPIRSAVVHTCVSKGAGQFAKAWLFDSPETTRDTAQPVAELAVSSSGSVSVSTPRPKAPEPAAIRNVAPNSQPVAEVAISPSGSVTASTSRPKAPEVAAVRHVAPNSGATHARGKSRLWAPVAMLLIAVGGSLFAYRNLVAPPDARGDERIARGVSPAARGPEAASDAAPAVEAPPVKALASAASDIPPSVQREAAAPARPETAASDVPRPPPAQRPQTAHTPQKTHTPEKAHTPHTAQMPQKAHVARAGGSSGERTRPVAAAPATGSTHAPAVERRLPIRSPEAPLASTSPATPPSSARTEASAQARSETAPVVAARRADVASPSPSGTRDEHLASAPAPRSSPPTQRAMPWLTRLRSALAACGRPGRFLNDVCREAARWNHCHPDHWDTVHECAVQRFASSGASN